MKTFLKATEFCSGWRNMLKSHFCMEIMLISVLLIQFPSVFGRIIMTDTNFMKNIKTKKQVEVLKGVFTFWTRALASMFSHHTIDIFLATVA